MEDTLSAMENELADLDVKIGDLQESILDAKDEYANLRRKIFEAKKQKYREDPAHYNDLLEDELLEQLVHSTSELRSRVGTTKQEIDSYETEQHGDLFAIVGHIFQELSKLRNDVACLKERHAMQD